MWSQDFVVSQVTGDCFGKMEQRWSQPSAHRKFAALSGRGLCARYCPAISAKICDRLRTTKAEHELLGVSVKPAPAICEHRGCRRRAVSLRPHRVCKKLEITVNTEGSRS